MTDITKRIGITSFAFYHKDIFEIADVLAEHQFGLEIHLNDFDYEIGNPEPLIQCGVWPRTFGSEQRQKLHVALQKLPFVTVHGTPFDLNVAANNPGIREESIRQYEEAMELAHDVGAPVCTYHPGRPSSTITPNSVVIQRHIEFAKRIAPQAERYGIRTGLENGGNPSFFSKIIGEVNSPYWGHLLDISHAIMGVKGDTRTVLNWIEHLGIDRIVEIHAHNVLAWSAVGGGMIDHVPFEDGTCLDMDIIFSKLRDGGYEGPIVLEIVQNTNEKVLDACRRARDIIVSIWEKKRQI